mgnify:FL=1
MASIWIYFICVFYIYTSSCSNNIISSIYGLFRSYSYHSSYSRSGHSCITYRFDHVTIVTAIAIISMYYKRLELSYLFKPQMNLTIMDKYFYITKSSSVINPRILYYWVSCIIIIELYYCIKRRCSIIGITEYSYSNHCINTRCIS